MLEVSWERCLVSALAESGMVQVRTESVAREGTIDHRQVLAEEPVGAGAIWAEVSRSTGAGQGPRDPKFKGKIEYLLVSYMYALNETRRAAAYEYVRFVQLLVTRYYLLSLDDQTINAYLLYSALCSL